MKFKKETEKELKDLFTVTDEAKAVAENNNWVKGEPNPNFGKRTKETKNGKE